MSRDGQRRIWTCPLEAGQTVEIGVEKVFDQGRSMSFIPCRADFAKKNLPLIIGISSETGRRYRYARGFMPDSVKVDI